MQIVFWILAILFSLAVGYWLYKADIRRAVPYPWLTASLRALIIMLTFLLLLAPSITIDKNETQKPVVLFLQDNSRSIPVSLKADTGKYKADAQELLEKLSKDYRVIRWGFGNDIQRDTLFQYTRQATDISNALSQAFEFYGQQNLGAVILATDGRYNQGLNPQFQDLPFQGSLYAVALGDSLAQRDIRITDVFANRTVSLNSQFEIRADLVAEMISGYSGNVQLREINGSATGNAAVNINTDRFDRAVSFTVRADKPGLHHYIISAPPADGEQNTSNNRRDVFVEVVSEKKNILIAAAAPHPDINAIREALEGLEGYQLTIRTGDNLPSSFADYNVIILHALPSQTNPVRNLLEAKKAVWLIMGAKANNGEYNRLQNLARLNVNTSNLQNVFAAYNGSFNAFTLPQNINAVMDKMPPLAVPAGSIDASPNALVLFRNRSNPQMPLWLLQQGAPPSALLMGEGLWRWRLFEYRHFNSHSVVDEAIRQTVSFLSANVNDRPFHVELAKHVWSDQEAVVLNAYLLNANNEQVNSSDVRISIADSAGRKQSFSFDRSGNAYQLNIGLREAGTYSYSASTTYNGKAYTSTGSFVVQSMPLEMLQTGADYPLLHSIAHKYNGSLVPSGKVATLYDSIKNNPNIQPIIQTTTETIPLVDWRWYFFLLLAVAATEWLLRKYWLAQ